MFMGFFIFWGIIRGIKFLFIIE